MANYKDDDEYQFPENEYSDDDSHSEWGEESNSEHSLGEEHADAHEFDSSESEQDHSALQTLKDKLGQNKRVVVAVLLAVLVLGGYGYMHWQAGQQTAVNMPSSTASTAAPPTTNQVSVTRPPAAVMVTNENTGEMNNRIAALKQTTADNQQAIVQMQSKLNGVSDSLSQIQDNQQQLNANMQQLQGELAELVKKAAQTPSKPAAPKVVAPPPPLQVYYLRAIVPGRAWVVDDQNNSRSIAVGDAVKDYGVVTGIDADQAVVSTSSGRTIIVKSDDN